DSLMEKVKQINNISILSAVVEVSKKEMTDLGSDLISRMKSGIVLLCQIEEDKCQLLLRVSPDLVERGIHADQLIKELAGSIEGSGGGKKEAAQAGGKNPKGVVIAFDKIKEILETD
ncbi:MAG: alanine--tRNA ligase, partial [Simkania sp.]|nr:alanine--tRNA ligase [Simkania sp.]